MVYKVIFFHKKAFFLKYMFNVNSMVKLEGERLISGIN